MYRFALQDGIRYARKLRLGVFLLFRKDLFGFLDIDVSQA